MLSNANRTLTNLQQTLFQKSSPFVWASSLKEMQNPIYSSFGRPHPDSKLQTANCPHGLPRAGKLLRMRLQPKPITGHPPWVRQPLEIGTSFPMELLVSGCTPKYTRLARCDYLSYRKKTTWSKYTILGRWKHCQPRPISWTAKHFFPALQPARLDLCHGRWLGIQSRVTQSRMPAK